MDATPSQERAIHDATRGGRRGARRRQRGWGLSDTVAEALESDIFDRDVVSARLNRDETDPFRAAVMSAIERLHAALDRQTFDVVLLDVMMPGMDGLEVLRRIRAKSSVPVLMLTARVPNSCAHSTRWSASCSASVTGT